MRKYKLKHSYFGEQTGISRVLIDTPDGTFMAESRVKDEDKENISSYAGCEYAEIKAARKWVKYKIRMAKRDLKLFEDFYNHISQAKAFNEKSFEASKMRRKIYELKETVRNLEQERDGLTQFLFSSFERREKFLKTMRNKKDKKS